MGEAEVEQDPAAVEVLAGGRLAVVVQQLEVAPDLGLAQGPLPLLGQGLLLQVPAHWYQGQLGLRLQGETFNLTPPKLSVRNPLISSLRRTATVPGVVVEGQAAAHQHPAHTKVKPGDGPHLHCSSVIHSNNARYITARYCCVPRGLDSLIFANSPARDLLSSSV